MNLKWKNWPEHLLDQFKCSRLYPGWKALKECYDEEDQKYFEVLENHFKGGRLRCEKPTGVA